MWKSLKAIQVAVERLAERTGALLALAQAVITEHTRKYEDLTRRVDTLERELRKPLHEAQILLEKAESRVRTARSAEERARRYAAESRDPEDYDDDEDLPVEIDAALGPGGGRQRLQSMPEDLPVRPPLDTADLARAAKFTRG